MRNIRSKAADHARAISIQLDDGQPQNGGRALQEACCSPSEVVPLDGVKESHASVRISSLWQRHIQTRDHAKYEADGEGFVLTDTWGGATFRMRA